MWRNPLVTVQVDVAQPEGASPRMWAARLLGAVVLSASTVALACSASGAVVADAGMDAAETGPTCESACDGGEVCSLNRCTSRECATVEGEHTSVRGCLFYTAQVENVESDAERAESLLVTNPSDDTAKVVLQLAQRAPDGHTDWFTLSGANVARASSSRFTVSGVAVKDAGLFQAAGVRLRSDRPVTVVSVASDDRVQGEVSSSGGTVVWPVQSLGGRYRVMTYPQLGTPAVTAVEGGRGGAGRITVVATGDTKLTVMASMSALVLATGGQPSVAGDPIPMRDGDVLQILSDGDGTDLSGTEIVADAPVAVFSGNLTTSYGRMAPGINSPDMAYEQMPPLEAWSKRYVAAALPPQADTCDSVLGGAGASLWRIVAAQPDTVVNFSAPAGLQGVPGTIKMDVGDAREFVVSGGSFSLSATKPVLVTQGIDCEPSLSLAISADEFLDDLWFATLPNFDQVAAVARISGQSVALDDVVLDPSLFRSAGGELEVALIPIPPCPNAALVCTHRLRGKFGMTLRGMDVYGSWALTVPAWQRCTTNPDNPTCRD